MIIKCEGKEVELKFTYNSFRYMEDFKISDLESVNENVFKIARLTQEMLLGAMNCEPLKKYTVKQVDSLMREYDENGELIELFSDLSELLSDSSFFKGLRAIG